MTTRASTAGLLLDRRDEAPHARIARREAVVIDQVLPDGHGVAPPAERGHDQLAVGLAGARLRCSTRLVPGRGGGVTRARVGRGCRRRVGGHLRRNGRVCRSSARTAPAQHHHASGLQVAAGRLAPDPGRPLDAPQRPAEASQGEDLLSFLFSQDVAHAGQEHAVPDRRQRLGALSEMAAFQVSTNGRFWVSTEVELDASRALAIHIFGFWLIRGMSVRDAGYGAETLAREVFEAAREADDDSRGREGALAGEGTFEAGSMPLSVGFQVDPGQTVIAVASALQPSASVQVRTVAAVSVLPTPGAIGWRWWTSGASTSTSVRMARAASPWRMWR